MSFSFHLACYIQKTIEILKSLKGTLYMLDKAVFALCTAVTGETSISPALKHLLLAENEFEFSQ